MVDDSAAIVEANDWLGNEEKPEVADNLHMEQTILKQKMSASDQSPNISLQMLLRADYLLSHLRLNCISRPFIIGPVSRPFFST